LVVRIWAEIAEASGVDADKVEDARQCAEALKAWVPKTEPS